MLKIISGGQTGADRAGLDFAIRFGLEHGGWCPKGRRSESGQISSRYLLKESHSSNYLVRTEHNVLDSNMTFIFTFGDLNNSRGSKKTAAFCHKHNRPYILVNLQSSNSLVSGVMTQYMSKEHVTINVAGSRESGAPGIHESVLALLSECYQKINYQNFDTLPSRCSLSDNKYIR